MKLGWNLDETWMGWDGRLSEHFGLSCVVVGCCKGGMFSKSVLYYDVAGTPSCEWNLDECWMTLEWIMDEIMMDSRWKRDGCDGWVLEHRTVLCCRLSVEHGGIIFWTWRHIFCIWMLQASGGDVALPGRCSFDVEKMWQTRGLSAIILCQGYLFSNKGAPWVAGVFGRSCY